jgi:SOS-response transcriptional repressor LexA
MKRPEDELMNDRVTDTNANDHERETIPASKPGRDLEGGVDQRATDAAILESYNEALRSEDLLAALAMHEETRRPDSPVYGDEGIVAWLDHEANSAERAADGWSIDQIRTIAAQIHARVTARLLKVRQIAGAPRLDPAVVTGTIPQVLDEAAGRRAAPQLDLSAAAGVGRDLWDEPCESWVELPDDVAEGRYIAVRIAGDSMIPLMHTGDTILVQLGTKLARDTVVLARLADGGYAVKRVGRVTPGRLELISLNPDFAPIVVPRDERTVIGTVVLRWCSHGSRASGAAG